MLVVVVAGLYYIRSGRVNRFILIQVQTALVDYGVRAEIGGLDLSWGVRTAKAHDIKLYNRETGQLLATIDNAELVVEIPNLYALRFRRDIIFKRVAFDNLQAYVELDSDGKTNFSGLHNPPPSAPGRISFDFSSLVGSLTSGTLHINDQAHRMAGDIEGLKGNAEPLPDGGTINLQFSFGPSHLRYEDRDTTVDSLDLAAHIGYNGGTIDHLNINSALGEIKTIGKVDDWSAFGYRAGVQAPVG